MKRAMRSGFTLGEVLTVIAIIALLAALILGLASSAQKKAARSKAEAEISQLENAVTDYQRKYGRVPRTRDDLQKELMATSFPITNLVDPWGMDYQYTNTSLVTFYLWSQGGDTAGTDRDMWIGRAP